jgi:hypothetical protein
MQDSTTSKTLNYIQNSFSLTSFKDDLKCLALFTQIYHWLKSKSSKFHLFKSHTKVAQRRDSMTLHLFKKIKDKSKNEFQILKDFPLCSSGDFISCFIRDTIIPFLINSPFVLQCNDIFMYQEVFF